MMRIFGCARITHLHGHLGGMEIATRKLYEGLAARGHEVSVVSSSLTDGQEEMIAREDGGVRYEFLPNCAPRQYSDKFHKGVRAQLEAKTASGWKPDIVHSASAGATGACRNAQNVPAVATWHGTFLEETLDGMSESVYLKGGRMLPVHVERALLGKILPLVVQGMGRDRRFGVEFEGHIAISDFMHKVLLSYGLPSASVATIPNSVDEAFFRARDLTKAECQARLGFEHPERIVLGLVGRGVPSKGYAFLFAALKFLDPKRFALLVVGNDSGIPDDIATPLKQVRVPHEDMPVAYRAMDIFVNPTVRLSGFDLTLQEALAAGVKTVVSNTSQYQMFYDTYIRDTAGLGSLSLFQVGDANSLGSSLVWLSQQTSPTPEKELVFLQQNFSVKTMIDKHIAFFNKVTSLKVKLAEKG